AAEEAAELEVERQVVVVRRALDRRQRLEIAEQVAQVFQLHVLIRRVGKRRIVVAAVGRGALPHGGGGIRLAPVADALLWVGRDGRGEERAERRLQRQGDPAARLFRLL